MASRLRADLTHTVTGWKTRTAIADPAGTALLVRASRTTQRQVSDKDEIRSMGQPSIVSTIDSDEPFALSGYLR